MNDPAKALVRAFGAANVVALAMTINSSAIAQTTGNATALDPIVVQSPTQKPAAKRNSAPARPRAARTGGNQRPNAVQQQPPAAGGGGARGAETAWGHVDGYVATRSGTGTKTDTPLIETPASVSVITQDQIQAQGAQSVAQAVRYTPGTRGEFAGADGRTDAVYVRGFAADQYLDSLRLLNFAIFAYPLVEPYNLERIEVLRGPASILFGQGSPGGVVDMVSKRPTDEPYHEMFLSTGNYDRIQAGVDLSGPIDKDKQFLYRLTASGFDVGSQVDHTGYQRISIAPSLTWRPDNETTFTILGTYQRDPKAGFYNQLPALGIGTINPAPNGLRIPTSFYSGEPGFDKTDRTYASIGYAFERKIGSTITFRQNMRYTDLNTDFAVVSPNTAQSDPGNLGRGAYTTQEAVRSFAIDNQGEIRFLSGPFQHTVLAGVDYRNGYDQTLNGSLTVVPVINAFNPVYGQPFGPVPLTTLNHQTIEQAGVYLQDQIKFDRWVALLGTREDMASSRTDSLAFTTGITTVSPKYDVANTKRAALLYKFDNGVAPYIQYTESFQPTAGADFFGKSFAPTTGQQEEAGIKYQPDPKSLYTLAVFDLTQQNVLTVDPVAAHGPTARVQTGEIRSRGLELEAKTEINRELTLLAAYTYLDNVVTKTNTLSQLGKHPTGFPANSASAWVDYTFHGGALDGFGLAGGVRYIGDSPGTSANTFTVPAVTLFDAAIHYDLSGLGPQFRGYKLQVNATNLFDKTYVTYCQDIGCYYGLRRQVIATLRYTW